MFLSKYCVLIRQKFQKDQFSSISAVIEQYIQILSTKLYFVFYQLSVTAFSPMIVRVLASGLQPGHQFQQRHRTPQSFSHANGPHNLFVCLFLFCFIYILLRHVHTWLIFGQS